MKKPSRHPHRRRESRNVQIARPIAAIAVKCVDKSRRQDRHSNRGSARRRPRLSREVAVLYEDDAVIVLNKPAGLLAVPIKGSDVPSALSLLIAELKPQAATRADRASH